MSGPYYRSKFALEFKEVLDSMMAEGNNVKDRVYHYSDFSDKSHTTVYLLINQSMNYLIDKLDPNGKYKSFLSLISIKRVRGLGVRLRYVSKVSFQPKVIDDVKEVEDNIEFSPNASLEFKIEGWLQNAKPKDVLELTELALDEEEVSKIKASLMPLSNILFKVESDRIKIRILTEKEMAEMAS